MERDSGASGEGGGAMKKGSGFDFARVWWVAAFVLIAAAAMLLYLRRTDMAIFAALLGVSAWLLNVKAGIKRKHDLVKDGARDWRPRAEVERRHSEADEDEE